MNLITAPITAHGPEHSGNRHSEVGATGFEPAAFWSQTRRSTKLSYAPDAERL